MKIDKKISKVLLTLGKGLILGYLITLGALLILSVLITYTPLNESYVSAIALGVTAIAVFLCGFKTARCAQSKGWLWGILSGLCYILIMMLIGQSSIENYTVGMKLLIMLGMAVAGGGLGGILGVNKA